MEDDDGLRVSLGVPGPNQSEFDLPLPPCPDCGGRVVWDEAGNVPGSRKCLACESQYNYSRDRVTGEVYLIRERYY